MKYLIALYIVFNLSACSNFLETDPIGRQLEINFYQNENQAFQALVSIYDVLAWGGHTTWGMPHGLFEAASDDCHAGGSDASDQPAWVAWDMFTLDPFIGPQEDLWGRYYAGIYRANLFLERIGDIPETTAGFKSRAIAEAKFLRAYFHFNLARIFGNVPIVLKTLSLSELQNISQSVPSEVYDQVEEDLNEAIADLPATVSEGELGRIAKGAAQALLGKTILFRSGTENTRMAEAATIFTDMINSGIYSLVPNYSDIFKESNEFNSESVFEIVHSGSGQYGDPDWFEFSRSSEGNYTTQFIGIRDLAAPSEPYAAGWSFCPVTPEMEELMRNDPRYEHSIINGNTIKANGGSYTEGFQNTNFFIKKYTPLKATLPTIGTTVLNWGQNYLVIRYADILLMAAETIVRSGGSESTAISYVNEVRQRAGANNLSPFITGSDLLESIYLERRLELAFEGHRYWDLVRTNRAATALSDKGFIAGTHEFLPIPQAEIDNTNGALVQNPGY